MRDQVEIVAGDRSIRLHRNALGSLGYRNLEAVDRTVRFGRATEQLNQIVPKLISDPFARNRVDIDRSENSLTAGLVADLPVQRMKTARTCCKRQCNSAEGLEEV